MKKQYIKQLKRILLIPRKKRKEIIEDLEEAFASALANGETEQAVVERLGSPDEFARNIEEQLGVNVQYQKGKRFFFLVVVGVIAIIFFSLMLFIQSQQFPKNVIGQADGMTSIQLFSPFPFNFSLLFLLLGIVALAVFTVLLIRYLRTRK